MKSFGLVAAGLVLLVTGVMNPVAAQAAAVSGNVMLGTKSAQAVVAAVPFNASTGAIDADHAVTTFTGFNGRFTVNPPSEQYLLVAWNGEEGAIVLDPTDGATIHLQRQEHHDAVAASSVYCTCRRLFWNIYSTCYIYSWTSDCFFTWGCGC